MHNLYDRLDRHDSKAERKLRPAENFRQMVLAYSRDFFLHLDTWKFKKKGDVACSSRNI